MPCALGRASMGKKGIYVRTMPSLVGPDGEKVTGRFDFGRVDPGIGREREQQHFVAAQIIENADQEPWITSCFT